MESNAWFTPPTKTRQDCHILSAMWTKLATVSDKVTVYSNHQYIGDRSHHIRDSLVLSPISLTWQNGQRTHSSYGDITFAAAGSRLYSSLPVQLLNPDITYGLLRRQLKWHIFVNHRHGALWLLICSALEKHLLTYLKNNQAVSWLGLGLATASPAS